MSDDGWDTSMAWADSLATGIPLAVQGALHTGAFALTSDAQATALYNNDTTATRASTLAFVADGTEGPLIGEAFAAGEARNPDRVAVEEAQPAGGPESISLILTAYTTYLQPLVTNDGGKRNFLTPTLETHAAEIAEQALLAIGDLFR